MCRADVILASKHFFNGNYNNDNNGLLKYTQWHKNCELQCAYMIQEIKLHLF